MQLPSVGSNGSRPTSAPCSDSDISVVGHHGWGQTPECSPKLTARRVEPREQTISTGPTSTTRSTPARLRLGLATVAGRLAATASRLLGRGAGTAIKGAVMLKVDPQALPHLLAGKHLAMVSGTNGKTSTTHFLAA